MLLSKKRIYILMNTIAVIIFTFLIDYSGVVRNSVALFIDTHPNLNINWIDILPIGIYAGMIIVGNVLFYLVLLKNKKTLIGAKYMVISLFAVILISCLVFFSKKILWQEQGIQIQTTRKLGTYYVHMNADLPQKTDVKILEEGDAFLSKANVILFDGLNMVFENDERYLYVNDLNELDDILGFHILRGQELTYEGDSQKLLLMDNDHRFYSSIICKSGRWKGATIREMIYFNPSGEESIFDGAYSDWLTSHHKIKASDYAINNHKCCLITSDNYSMVTFVEDNVCYVFLTESGCESELLDYLGTIQRGK